MVVVVVIVVVIVLLVLVLGEKFVMMMMNLMMMMNHIHLLEERNLRLLLTQELNGVIAKSAITKLRIVKTFYMEALITAMTLLGQMILVICVAARPVILTNLT